jgi:hypothetical protein
MSMHDRAAQFSPFAALTGYGDAVAETARYTDLKIELDEYAKVALDEKLIRLQEVIRDKPEVTITYFLPDTKKTGGSYQTITGTVKKIDVYQHRIVMDDATEIPMDDMVEIIGSFDFSESSV